MWMNSGGGMQFTHVLPAVKRYGAVFTLAWSHLLCSFHGATPWRCHHLSDHLPLEVLCAGDARRVRWARTNTVRRLGSQLRPVAYRPPPPPPPLVALRPPLPFPPPWLSPHLCIPSVGIDPAIGLLDHLGLAILGTGLKQSVSLDNLVWG